MTEQTASNGKSDPAERLEQALERFERALDALDSAADEALANRFGSKGAERELHAMMDDRRELARQLDRAEARSKTLGEANAQVSRRIVGVMENIRTVMEN